MKVVLFTSMNQAYYNNYGRHMVESYKKYMLPKMPLYIYNEDFSINDPDINELNWPMDDNYFFFQKRWETRPRITLFAKKGFSVIHAMENIEADYLIWVDADCQFVETISTRALEILLDRKYVAGCFGVWHKKSELEYYSCETGVFVLNKKHQDFSKFRDRYKDIYIHDDTSNLRRFYDGEVFGAVVKELTEQGIMIQDFSLLKQKRYKTPIKHSFLNEFIKHFKGKGLKNRKFK